MFFPTDGSRCERCYQSIREPDAQCTYRADTPGGRTICYPCAEKRERAMVNSNTTTKWVCFLSRGWLLSYSGGKLLKVVDAKEQTGEHEGQPVPVFRIWAVDGHERLWFGRVWGKGCAIGANITMRRTDRRDGVGRPQDFGLETD